MIMSGWILPDYTMIKCKSSANSQEHITIVKKYLENLSVMNPNIYYLVAKSINNMNISSLDDLAVIVLGWIKVNDVPIKIIYYSNNCVFENVIIRYKNLGYSLVPIYNFKHIVIPNPSQYI